MNAIAQPERTTQDRVIALFRDELHLRKRLNQLPVRHEAWGY